MLKYLMMCGLYKYLMKLAKMIYFVSLRSKIVMMDERIFRWYRMKSRRKVIFTPKEYCFLMYLNVNVILTVMCNHHTRTFIAWNYPIINLRAYFLLQSSEIRGHCCYHKHSERVYYHFINILDNIIR